MKNLDTLIDAIGVTAQLCGNEIQPAALVIFAEDLDARYTLEQILPALSRCRREVRGRLTPTDVISRIDDGRPGPEQAWSNLPKDETVSLFWTAEMALAWGAARDLIGEDDVAARMAFREVYVDACRKARDAGLPVVWTHCFGTDYQGRVEAMEDAVAKRLISPSSARAVMPELDDRRLLALASGQSVPAISTDLKMPERIVAIASSLSVDSLLAECKHSEGAKCETDQMDKLQRHRELIASMSAATTAATSLPARTQPERSARAR